MIAHAEQKATTLAEEIARDSMRAMGVSFPQGNSKWSEVVDAAQRHIDRHVDAMRRVAGENPIPSAEVILAYEVRASWWAKHVSWSWIQKLAAWYFSWKVRRKYRRFDERLRAADAAARA